MAKAAKSVEVDISPGVANGFVRSILAHYANIESARGTYMQAARGEREGMVAQYERLAAAGVPQKSAKLEIQIVRTLEKLRGLYDDLEAEDRKMLDKLAQARGDERQMSLFDIAPKQSKVKSKARRKTADANGSGLAAEGSA